MTSKHTPGPLTVRMDDKWPFQIRTFNAQGECVFSRDMPSYSTRQKTLAECLDGKHMGDLQWSAQVVNARAVADEVLRAAAPELLEAAKLVLAWYEAEDDHSKEPDFYKRIAMCRASENAIRAAIAKATGEQA